MDLTKTKDENQQTSEITHTHFKLLIRLFDCMCINYFCFYIYLFVYILCTCLLKQLFVNVFTIISFYVYLFYLHM